MRRLDRIGGLILICWFGFGVYYFQPNLGDLLNTSDQTIDVQHFLVSSETGDMGYLNRRYLRDPDSTILKESAGAIIRFGDSQCFVRSTLSIDLSNQTKVKSFETRLNGSAGETLLRGKYLQSQDKFELMRIDGSKTKTDLTHPPHLVSTLFNERPATEKTDFRSPTLDPYRGSLEKLDVTHVKEDTVDIFGDKRESSRYRLQPADRVIDFHVGSDGDILLRRLGKQTVMIAVSQNLGRANTSKINREGSGLDSSSCRSPDRAIEIFQRLFGNRLVTSLEDNTSDNDE
jgi:hypothetical protein